MARKIKTYVYSPSVSCDINNVTGISTIIKTCSVKITTIASNFKDIYINKPPLPSDEFEDVNTSILCINTTDIDDIEGSNSYSLKDIAKCFTITYENIPHSVLLGDENLNNTYVSRDAQASCQLVPPFILNKNIHILVSQNIIVIWILWSKYSFRFLEQSVIISSLIPEGSLSKVLFETAYSASSSTGVDALKFRLVQYDTLYGGQSQQDSSECLMMLIEVINKDSVPYCGSNDNNQVTPVYRGWLYVFVPVRTPPPPPPPPPPAAASCPRDNFWTTFFHFWHDCWPWPVDYLIRFWSIFVVTLN